MVKANSDPTALKTLIKSTWSQFESQFEDVLTALTRHTKILEAETTLAHRQTVHIERQRRVMEWLNPVEIESDFLRERNKRANKTCSWILSRPEYENWRSTEKHDDSILWINGRPGGGKSVLSTCIIEELQRRREETKNCDVVYFYFSKNDQVKSTSLSLVVSIIAQLVGRMPSFPPILFSSYESAAKFGRAHISESDDPARILESLVKEINCLYLVLDGLDECSDINKTVETMLRLTSQNVGVRLLCISRETGALKKHLGGHSTIYLKPGDIKDDIDNFLSDEIRDLSECLGCDLHPMLFNRLSRDAEGNFLWAYLMTYNLKGASSLFEIKSMMDKVPKGLAELYESIMSDFGKETEATQKIMKAAFMWICCGTRPISWPELQTALAIDTKDEELDPLKIPFKPVILRLCSPLIEYSAEEDVFRPIHLSLCEFFLDPESYTSNDEQLSSFTRSFCTPRNESNAFITTACLTYLGLSSIGDSITHDKSKAPLVGYATSSWCHHLVQSKPNQELQDKLISFLSSSRRRRIWQTRWLLMGMAGYQLPRILQVQRLILSWIKEHKFSEDCNFDALEDMLVILLSFDTSPPGYLEIPSLSSQIHIGHFEKMMVVRDLARSYTVTGRLDDGRKWLEDTLVQQEAKHGKDSPETVWILNSLGMIYDQQRLFGLSAETQLRALNIQKAKLPPGHLDAVWTSNELGRVYRHLSRLDEAVTAHLEALTILEGILPKDDSHIVWTTNCLARTYRFQGKLDDALALHRRALEIQTRTLGASHPHNLWTASDIGRCLRDQGRLQEAYEQLLEVLEGRQKVYGTKHADTYWSMNDVGLLLTQLGRKREAKVYHEKALAGQKELLGDNDGMTMWTKELLDSLEIENKL